MEREREGEREDGREGANPIVSAGTHASNFNFPDD